MRYGDGGLSATAELSVPRPRKGLASGKGCGVWSINPELVSHKAISSVLLLIRCIIP
jgi:hypothetical protein